MIREDTVFGPIHSRRLGSSLGINLMPTQGKICNFDCIYCECGWNADGRTDTRLPQSEEVFASLEAALSKTTEHIDSITFSGDGEPTLHPNFAQIIDGVLEIRNHLAPGAKVSVLSNATMVHKEEVFRALRRVDNPILKIDAPTNELAAIINHPAPGYDIRRVVSSLEQFEGDFILQTMFLRCPGFDSASDAVLLPWMDIVRHLRPRQVMAYTIDRPVPMAGLQKISKEELQSLLKPLQDEGFEISIFA